MKKYKMSAKVWVYPGMAHSTSGGQAGSWHFINLPKKQSADIKKTFGRVARGWGSLPVSVTVGKTSWRTSIFPDKKAGAYLLPLKVQVRKKEEIYEGDVITLTIEIRG